MAPLLTRPRSAGRRGRGGSTLFRGRKETVVKADVTANPGDNRGGGGLVLFLGQLAQGKDRTTGRQSRCGPRKSVSTIQLRRSRKTTATQRREDAEKYISDQHWRYMRGYDNRSRVIFWLFGISGGKTLRYSGMVHRLVYKLRVM